jgi:hypothetical protein
MSNILNLLIYLEIVLAIVILYQYTICYILINQIIKIWPCSRFWKYMSMIKVYYKGNCGKLSNCGYFCYNKYINNYGYLTYNKYTYMGRKARF